MAEEAQLFAKVIIKDQTENRIGDMKVYEDRKYKK